MRNIRRSDRVGVMIPSIFFVSPFLSSAVPRLTWLLLLIVAIALIVPLPLSFLAYKGNLHMAPWLPYSARARVIIWEYTAERVLDHPWLGIGADSTRALREQRETAEKPEGFVIKRTAAWHAHDFFLQVWYELGLVGVVLIAFAGSLLALRMRVLPPESQPFACATFAAFTAIAAFSWGIWQTWLMCGIALMLLHFGVAAGTAKAPPETPVNEAYHSWQR